MCRRSVLWGIGKEKVSGILVIIKRTKKEGGKIPVLADVGSMADWCRGVTPWLVSVRGFTCRID